MRTGLGALQGVLFTNSFDLSDSLLVAQTLGNLKTIKFDGNPTILPLPKDAPLEVPRIILRTADNSFSLNISPIRIDLFYNSNKNDQEGIPTKTLADIQSQVITLLKEIAGIVVNKFSAHINRSAVIINSVVKLQESSKKYFMENFVKAEGVHNPNEIQLNFLMNKEFDKYKVNEWLRLHTLRNQKNPTDDTAMLIILDINSLAEVDYNFNKETLDTFLKGSFSLASNELEQYISGRTQNG